MRTAVQRIGCGVVFTGASAMADRSYLTASGRRQDHAQEQGRAAGAEVARGAQVDAVDLAHAGDGVHQDREEGAERDQLEDPERSLVHEGLKHYFIVNFPQEPGALRRFLDEVLGPDDDIALFDYVKRSDRETGPAFVGITLGRPDDLAGLLERMDASPLQIEKVPQDSPLFRMFV